MAYTKYKSRLCAIGALLLISCASGFIVLFQAHKSRAARIQHEQKNRFMMRSQATYVDNKLCLGCHQFQAKEWVKSHHALSMTPAKAPFILGNFNHVILKHQEMTTLFFKKNNKYYLKTIGPNSKYAEYPIQYAFGYYPLQQYLIELPGGRLQNFTIAWDIKQSHWYDLYPHEKTTPNDVLHWTGRYQTTNTMCLECHTTHYQKNFDAINDRYTSTWSEINVSCQSCHGPGSDHVLWANKIVRQPTVKKVPAESDGLSVHFKKNDANTLIDTCGICHSRRSLLASDPKVGQPLLNNYLPTLLQAGLYYPDGQQLAEVYVYNSFRQSKMYQMGVSCIDCHNPHTGKLKVKGNALCTTCHSLKKNMCFPSAAGDYDDQTHHFHKMGSKAAECISCHMPAQNYMIIHPRPDHSIRIPRPDLSIKLGTPNACNNCHSDKSATWAQDAINKWYGIKFYSKIHYGEIIAAGRTGQPDAEQDLIDLTKDLSQPNIVRATAFDLLRNYGAKGVSACIEGLDDKDPEVRRPALSCLERLTPEARLRYAAPLLTDSILAVRIEAARILSSIPQNLFSASTYKIFNSALAEYIQSQKIALDMPASSLNLAVLNENLGKIKKAEQYYLNALHIDPDFTPARLNLAHLYNSINQNNAAIGILKEGIKRIPNQGELHYALGLLFAEEKKLPEAIATLAQAVKLLPLRVRVHYNYALALQQAGERKKCEQVLLHTHQLAPNDSEIIYALVIFYMQDKNWKEVKHWTNKLKP